MKIYKKGRGSGHAQRRQSPASTTRYTLYTAIRIIFLLKNTVVLNLITNTNLNPMSYNEKNNNRVI